MSAPTEPGQAGRAKVRPLTRSTACSPCPACGSAAVRSLGSPRVTHTGIVTAHPEAVCRCSSCDLLFFVPVQSQEVLLAQYRRLTRDFWSEPTRPDWALARDAILRRVSSGSVLDVGCWTGGFLSTLPPHLRRYAIEPSDWARGQAIGRGVSIVGSSLDDLAASEAAYEVVTMLDVIEHTTEPLETLAAAAARVKDGGILIVSTGDSHALPWRLMPRDYWYYYGEHVCFYSRDWFRWAASRTGLMIERAQNFSRFPPAWIGAPLAELFRAYTVHRLGGPRAFPVRAARRAHLLPADPDTRHWPDHLLVVFRKRRGLSPRGAR
jgi:SAM-dependent methyltransferase